MIIVKPKFWNKKNSLISLLLIPISFILQSLIVIKKKIYCSKFIQNSDYLYWKYLCRWNWKNTIIYYDRSRIDKTQKKTGNN